MPLRLLSVLLLLSMFVLTPAVSGAPAPMGTAFTYQGRLAESGTAYTGNADFEFELYDTDGVSVAGPIQRTAVPVSDGLFTTELDFGAVFNGDERFLEIRVKTTGPTYTTLTPRQELTPAPYAIHATSSQTATSATTATNADQLDGIDSTGFSLTGHTHAASTITGVGNGEVVFGSGGGLAGDPAQFTYDSANNNLSVANNINAGGVYQINSGTVLRVAPTANTFVGLTGNTTVSGTGNTALGQNALAAANAVDSNVAVGSSALAATVSGAQPYFGDANTAVGASSLSANTTGFANTAVGTSALGANTSGYLNTAVGATALDALNGAAAGQNTAVGYNALGVVTNANDNTAVGANALAANTASANTAVGVNALMTNTGGIDNTAVGAGALRFNLTGNRNSALGLNALTNNTAADNTAMGALAASANTTGAQNTAMGASALSANQTGTGNVAIGAYALDATTTASNNTAVGASALDSLTLGAGDNTALGSNALAANTVGFRNTVIGRDAGRFNATGSDNIYLGFQAGNTHNAAESNNIVIGNPGSAGDSGRIRIGTSGTHTNTRVAGINGTTIAGNAANVTLVDANGQLGTAAATGPVRIGSVFGATSAGGTTLFINASGDLGTTTSSRRFKEDIREMGDASDQLLRLRPVVFKYRPEVTSDRSDQFGLIAEEVNEVNPEWVVRDAAGEINSVRYDQINAALLGLVQRQNAEITELQKQLAALAERLARVEAAGRR